MNTEDMNINIGDLCSPIGNGAISYIDPVGNFPTNVWARRSDVLLFIGWVDIVTLSTQSTSMAVFLLPDGTIASLYNREFKLL